MDTSVYAEADTSGNTTYNAVSVNPTDERMTTHYTKVDISKITFDTEKKWEEWYKQYSLLMGFGVRREDVRMNRNGEVTMRKWVCSKEGFRRTTANEEQGTQRQQRSITRCGCRAFLRVNLDKRSNTWVVKDIELTHNHEMIDTHQTFLIRSHCSLTEGKKAQVQSLFQTGIKQTQIYEQLAHQARGYTYGYRQTQRGDDDAESALCFLQGKSSVEPNFFYSVKTDADGRLECLFWSDSTSRLDYACFGDVVAFESMYETNKYNLPCMILVSVNHHHQTIVFGCGLLNVETEETYTWLLQTFHDGMNDKSPISVVTNGDKAMRNAIKEVFPNAHHKLCSWHLARNAKSHIQDNAALHAFNKCMFDIQTREQFQENWNSMIENFGLQEEAWLRKMYTKRAMWAEAYLRGHFLAGLRSTQRCEGMDSYLKSSLQERLSLVEFMQQYHKALDGLQHAEAYADYVTQHMDPPPPNTPLPDIETHAKSVYTRKSFDEVVDRMKAEGNLFQVQVSRMVQLEIRTYTLETTKDPTLRWDVVFDPKNVAIACSCLEFETVGLPCEHAFHIMKVERLKEIPKNLISLRWTRFAKSNIRSAYHSLCDPNNITRDPNNITEVVRYGALSSRCNKLCYFASRSDEAYRQFSDGLDKLTQQMDGLHTSDIDKNHQGIAGSSGRPQILKDPLVVQAKGGQNADKGNQIKKRKFGQCNEGHTKCTCPLSNISMMDSNYQMSSPTLDLSSN